MADDGEGEQQYQWTSLEPLPEGQEEAVTAKFVKSAGRYVAEPARWPGRTATKQGQH
jgi:hypothetical protein